MRCQIRPPFNFEGLNGRRTSDKTGGSIEVSSQPFLVRKRPRNLFLLLIVAFRCTEWGCLKFLLNLVIVTMYLLISCLTHLFHYMF